MRKTKGFTLVEVLIVIVLFAIVLMIAAPNIIKWIDYTEKRNCKLLTNNMLNEIQNACFEKRFSSESYIDDINDEILKVVEFYANDSLKVKTISSEFQITASNICVHGGTHTIKWHYVSDEKIIITASCDRHNEVFTLDTSLGIKNTDSTISISPNITNAIDVITDITKLLDNVYENTKGNTNVLVQAFLDGLLLKINTDSKYSKYFSSQDIDNFDTQMDGVSIKKNSIFDKYIIQYLYNSIMFPYIVYESAPYPLYISIQGERFNPDKWVFYSNDGYGGTSTKNYANLFCCRSFIESNGKTIESRVWYKYVSGYLNINDFSFSDNEKLADYIKNNINDFVKIN